MDNLPQLKRMRAGSLSPELYSEISEFFSSGRLDVTISGRTSLYTIYNHLKGAMRDRRMVRRAERMIRALCAAIDARELRVAKAPVEKVAEKKKRERLGKALEEQEEEMVERMEGRFRQLGITDRKAMGRVLRFLGEDEFAKRQELVLKALPERAYKPLFGNVPDLLTAPDFPFVVALVVEKVKVIDGVSAAGRASGLDYTRDPNVLLFPFHEIAERANLSGKIERIVAGGKLPRMRQEEAGRISEKLGLERPENLIAFLKRLGFAITPLAGRAFSCIKMDEGGNLESVIYIDFGKAKRCHPVALSELFGQAAVAEKAREAAGAGR